VEQQNTLTIVNPVEDFAAMSLRLWRHAGHSDQEILQTLTAPNPDADKHWEEGQRRRVGLVYAPPLEVKAHIRRLVLLDIAAAAA
jgi:hypothetical protein